MPLRIATFRNAMAIAHAAGRDEGNRRARRAGRQAWDEADHCHAVDAFYRVVRTLGFGDGRHAPEDGRPSDMGLRPKQTDLGV